MKNFPNALNSTIAAAVLSVSAQVAFASALLPPDQRCDFNKDGLITGDEIAALAKVLVSAELQSYDENCDGQISATELARINQLAQTAIQDDLGIQEADLIAESQIAPIKVEPTPKAPERQPSQRFFFSKDKVSPSFAPRSQSGGIFSFSDDRERGSSALTVDTVLTYRLLDPDRDAPKTGPFGNVGLAAYLDLNGTVNSDADDVTSAILGIDAILNLEPTKLFNLQQVSIGPYFQTDFDGNAEIYGLNASWSPIQIEWQLGNARLQSGDLRNNFLWSANADLNYRSVKKTGETKLALGEQFWVGVNLGAKIFPFGSIDSATPHIDIDFSTHRNLKNGNDATLASFALSFPFSTAEGSAAVVSYEYGENYLTGARIDKTTVGFSYKF